MPLQKSSRVQFDNKVRLTNRHDGSYAVYAGATFLGFVRKLNKQRWTCAPTGTGADPRIEVTEHSTRHAAIERLANL